MKPPENQEPDRVENAVASAAAVWVMRQDRGLSPAEQDDFLQWLAADPRHAEALGRQRGAWEAFDRLAGLQSTVPAAPDPDLLSPISRREQNRDGKINAPWRLVALAATVAVSATIWWPGARPNVDSPPPARAPSAGTAHLPPIEERILEDGSTIRLNRGAIVSVDFSPSERRVRLERGEAAFSVTKDSHRPFVVDSSGVLVRAVGTAFNVRLANQVVEVIMTEGRVAVEGGRAVAEFAISDLIAGQRAVVPLHAEGGAPAVVSLTDDELSRRLAWQPRLLSFTDETLASILTEFNRHNPVVLRVDTPALQALRLTARLRSDNVQGFLRLLASDFGVRAETAANGEIVLRAARERP